MRGRGSAAAHLSVIRHAPPTRMAIQLHSPVADKLAGYIATNRATPGLTMVQPNVVRGRHAVICGAGPSLARFVPDGFDDVFACNSALGYLLARDVPVAGAVGIDQSPGLLREWSTPPDVPYYVASSCDPALIAHLLDHGRTLRFFHNYVGVEGERDAYNETWPPGYLVGEGFTVASRFIGVARWMGYERIDLVGADCAFGEHDLAHANGDSAAHAYGAPLIMQGEIDGRVWRTRPDMLREAVHLVRRVRSMNGALRLIGDTLPVALLAKSDNVLDAVCRDITAGEAVPLPT